MTTADEYHLATEQTVRNLRSLLGNGKLHQMLILASRIGASSGMIDPMSGLDRKELRKWHDEVIAALGRDR